jgi:hypothetical protein
VLRLVLGSVDVELEVMKLDTENDNACGWKKRIKAEIKAC